jgi:hypothetical protein
VSRGDLSADTFRVIGTVEEEGTGRPLGNLVVRAFDRDLIYDDTLGFANTDAEGRFEIRYGEADFRDLFESKPDLYLRVFDAGGTRLLHETTDAIRWNASNRERYRIRIPARALDPKHFLG